MRLATLPVLLVLLGAGCAGTTAGGTMNGPLLPSLQASTLDDSVHFVLQVTNTGTEPVELRFRSGQSHDFVVLDGEREIWRWSGEMMFTQALRRETLAPGATLTFEEAWRPPETLQGELVAVGRLVAENHPIEQRTRFRLP